MKARIATIIAAVALAACAGTDFQWSQVEQIKPGMTVAQVEQIMGKPNNTMSTPQGLVLVWAHANGITASTKAVSVRFVDGRVVEAPESTASY